MIKKILFFSFLIFLSGCVSFETKVAELQKNAKLEDYGTPPSDNYLDFEKEILKASLVDPDSALFRNNTEPYRCAFAPTLFSRTPVLGWCSTIEMNAKNRMGGYMGYHTYRFTWLNGKISDPRAIELQLSYYLR